MSELRGVSRPVSGGWVPKLAVIVEETEEELDNFEQEEREEQDRRERREDNGFQSSLNLEEDPELDNMMKQFNQRIQMLAKNDWLRHPNVFPFANDLENDISDLSKFYNTRHRKPTELMSHVVTALESPQMKIREMIGKYLQVLAIRDVDAARRFFDAKGINSILNLTTGSDASQTLSLAALIPFFNDEALMLAITPLVIPSLIRLSRRATKNKGISGTISSLVAYCAKSPIKAGESGVLEALTDFLSAPLEGSNLKVKASAAAGVCLATHLDSAQSSVAFRGGLTTLRNLLSSQEGWETHRWAAAALANLSINALNAKLVCETSVLEALHMASRLERQRCLKERNLLVRKTKFDLKIRQIQQAAKENDGNEKEMVATWLASLDSKVAEYKLAYENYKESLQNKKLNENNNEFDEVSDLHFADFTDFSENYTTDGKAIINSDFWPDAPPLEPLNDEELFLLNQRDIALFIIANPPIVENFVSKKNEKVENIEDKTKGSSPSNEANTTTVTSPTNNSKDAKTSSNDPKSKENNASKKDSKVGEHSKDHHASDTLAPLPSFANSNLNAKIQLWSSEIWKNSLEQNRRVGRALTWTFLFLSSHGGREIRASSGIPLMLCMRDLILMSLSSRSVNGSRAIHSESTAQLAKFAIGLLVGNSSIPWDDTPLVRRAKQHINLSSESVMSSALGELFSLAHSFLPGLTTCLMATACGDDPISALAAAWALCQLLLHPSYSVGVLRVGGGLTIVSLLALGMHDTQLLALCAKCVCFLAQKRVMMTQLMDLHIVEALFCLSSNPDVNLSRASLQALLSLTIVAHQDISIEERVIHGIGPNISSNQLRERLWKRAQAASMKFRQSSVSSMNTNRFESQCIASLCSLSKTGTGDAQGGEALVCQSVAAKFAQNNSILSPLALEALLSTLRSLSAGGAISSVRSMYVDACINIVSAATNIPDATYATFNETFALKGPGVSYFDDKMNPAHSLMDIDGASELKDVSVAAGDANLDLDLKHDRQLMPAYYGASQILIAEVQRSLSQLKDYKFNVHTETFTIHGMVMPLHGGNAQVYASKFINDGGLTSNANGDDLDILEQQRRLEDARLNYLVLTSSLSTLADYCFVESIAKLVIDSEIIRDLTSIVAAPVNSSNSFNGARNIFSSSPQKPQHRTSIIHQPKPDTDSGEEYPSTADIHSHTDNSNNNNSANHLSMQFPPVHLCTITWILISRVFSHVDRVGHLLLPNFISSLHFILDLIFSALHCSQAQTGFSNNSSHTNANQSTHSKQMHFNNLYNDSKNLFKNINSYSSIRNNNNEASSPPSNSAPSDEHFIPTSKILTFLECGSPDALVAALGLPICVLLLTAVDNAEVQRVLSLRGPLLCMLVKHAIRVQNISLLTTAFKVLATLINTSDTSTVQSLGSFSVALLDLTFTALQISVSTSSDSPSPAASSIPPLSSGNSAELSPSSPVRKASKISSTTPFSHKIVGSNTAAALPGENIVASSLLIKNNDRNNVDPSSTIDSLTSSVKHPSLTFHTLLFLGNLAILPHVRDYFRKLKLINVVDSLILSSPSISSCLDDHSITVLLRLLNRLSHSNHLLAQLTTVKTVVSVCSMGNRAVNNPSALSELSLLLENFTTQVDGVTACLAHRPARDLLAIILKKENQTPRAISSAVSALYSLGMQKGSEATFQAHNLPEALVKVALTAQDSGVRSNATWLLAAAAVRSSNLLVESAEIPRLLVELVSKGDSRVAAQAGWAISELHIESPGILQILKNSNALEVLLERISTAIECSRSNSPLAASICGLTKLCSHEEFRSAVIANSQSLQLIADLVYHPCAPVRLEAAKLVSALGSTAAYELVVNLQVATGLVEMLKSSSGAFPLWMGASALAAINSLIEVEDAQQPLLDAGLLKELYDKVHGFVPKILSVAKQVSLNNSEGNSITQEVMEKTENAILNSNLNNRASYTANQHRNTNHHMESRLPNLMSNDNMQYQTAPTTENESTLRALMTTAQIGAPLRYNGRILMPLKPYQLNSNHKDFSPTNEQHQHINGNEGNVGMDLLMNSNIMSHIIGEDPEIGALIQEAVTLELEQSENFKTNNQRMQLMQSNISSNEKSPVPPQPNPDGQLLRKILMRNPALKARTLLLRDQLIGLNTTSAPQPEISSNSEGLDQYHHGGRNSAPLSSGSLQNNNNNSNLSKFNSNSSGNSVESEDQDLFSLLQGSLTSSFTMPWVVDAFCQISKCARLLSVRVQSRKELVAHGGIALTAQLLHASDSPLVLTECVWAVGVLAADPTSETDLVECGAVAAIENLMRNAKNEAVRRRVLWTWKLLSQSSKDYSKIWTRQNVTKVDTIRMENFDSFDIASSETSNINPMHSVRQSTNAIRPQRSHKIDLSKSHTHNRATTANNGTLNQTAKALKGAVGSQPYDYDHYNDFSIQNSSQNIHPNNHINMENSYLINKGSAAAIQSSKDKNKRLSRLVGGSTLPSISNMPK